MSDLKPCPYCGGEAHLSADTSHSTAFFIGCETEDCFGLMMWAERKDAAIAAWNLRAAPDPVLSDPRVKALVEAANDAVLVLEEADCQGSQVMADLLAALRAIGGE